MTTHLSIKLALLRCLNRTPRGYAQPETALSAEACLTVVPRPTQAEIDVAIQDLESAKLIIGMTNALSEERRWMITDTGRMQLAEINN